jgi:hypothetical protein
MRRTERLPVELTVTWNRAGRDYPCSAADVNAHGLFVRTDHIVEPGSLMHLRVQLPDRVLEMFVTARFIGKTMSGHGIGVEIFLIDEVSQCHWLAFYEQLCAEHTRDRRQAAVGG